MQNSIENLFLLSSMTWIHDVAALQTVLTGEGGKEVVRLVRVDRNHAIRSVGQNPKKKT